MHRATKLLILTAVTLGIWWIARPPARSPESRAAPVSSRESAAPSADGTPAAAATPAPPNAPAAGAPGSVPVVPAPPVPPVAPPAPVPADSLLPPPAGRAAVTDLDDVQVTLREYRNVFRENPVGSNAEIMRALNGANPRQVRLGPPAGQSLNAAGELCDRWGTPYFFHQISGTRMEIRSAGPDRTLWTDDDVQR